MKNLILLKITLIVALFLHQNFAYAYDYEISENELQLKVTALMPLEFKKFAVTTRLNDANVELIENQNGIIILSNVSVILPNQQEYFGNLKIDSSLTYDPSINSFYLKNINIVSLEFDKLPANYINLAKIVTQLMLNNLFNKYPIYVIKDGGIKNSIAKSFLKTVSIGNKKLMLNFSLF